MKAYHTIANYRRTYERGLFRMLLQVVRTAQYGCNCRGAGGNGGCGEFDIVEAGREPAHEVWLFV